MRRLAASVACCLLFAAGGLRAQEAKDAKEAEQRLQSVRGELREVAAQRRKLENQRGQASQRLREADEQVGSTQRALQQTQAQLQQDAQELARLQAERGRQAEALAARRAELARLLRAAQVAGDAPALKALLAQDRVADGERELAYQGYLQRAQAARIRELGEEIAHLQGLEDEITRRQRAMEAARRQQARQLAQLQQARQQRAGLLAKLDHQYKDRSAREQALGQDAKALQQLLAQLRAAAARAAREAAQAKAEAERQARASGKPVPRPTVASAPALRVGGLSWPVAGGLLAGYAGRLPDGRRSDGVLIAAGAGTPVKAVADGTVVFADWMTGYGNILIIDHGNGYMSLYAHNDSLLRSAGDAVRRGDAVATVGTSGGQAVPALYFELRHNGAPVNPAAWLSRQ
ncbi:peptidoglycan DD-metalloendopeptidase family protein [Thermomonas sp. S9]|uniref:murein hydrolase activator EnvC family protein n=1 Tax=Thermomonas sp. S9 TaxID=2885203 RepID=UPI00216AED0C|nr:peptidoglycan DD-metalloendopeptidase family protein [Thermomonas sp. S9]MCR6495445.1 peptidoglycan DD-metalloendopeptidase family protein [Thermomonas sp. S9]